MLAVEERAMCISKNSYMADVAMRLSCIGTYRHVPQDLACKRLQCTSCLLDTYLPAYAFPFC
jgi:hypothetical protein